MRIGLEAKRLFLNDRGLGNYARNLLQGLVRYYHDNSYHLYTTKAPTTYFDPNNYSGKLIIHQPEGWWQNATKSAWRSLNLGKVSSKDNLDVFHGLAQELPKDIHKSKTKSVVTIHDMIFLRHPEFYKPIDRWIYFNKVKFAVNNVDRIIAISNQTKNDLVDTFKLSEDKIDVVYQSCNEVFYQKRTEEELAQVKNKWSLPEHFLLYVGALNGNKNVMIILKALARLKSELDLPLVVVGHGDTYKSKLREFANKHEISNKLIFASERANPTPYELSSFYQLASVFIFPSLYEGFGIPILEARFSGTPVIASNSSCLEEAGEQDSYYFDPHNEEQLSELILQVLLKTNHTIRVSDKFTLKGSTDQIYSIYQH